jgi:chromatin segregation and condensation protein Rec8/ScpA/Scc1 (kleisin family)
MGQELRHRGMLDPVGRQVGDPLQRHRVEDLCRQVRQGQSPLLHKLQHHHRYKDLGDAADAEHVIRRNRRARDNVGQAGAPAPSDPATRADHRRHARQSRFSRPYKTLVEHLRTHAHRDLQRSVCGGER